jgi:hypothetical protein
MAAGTAPMPSPPTNAPGTPLPPPPFTMQGMVPFAPAAQADTKMGPLVLGLLGGVLALLGAVIGWMQVQSCASAMGFSMCVAVPVPPSYAIGNFDAFVAMAPLLALAFGVVGMAVVCLQKPTTGLVAGLMGVLSLVMAVLWLVRATPFFATIQSQMGGASASVSVGAGFGLYITMFGALMLAIGGLVQWKALKAQAAKAVAPAVPAPVA